MTHAQALDPSGAPLNVAAWRRLVVSPLACAACSHYADSLQKAGRLPTDQMWRLLFDAAAAATMDDYFGDVEAAHKLSSALKAAEALCEQLRTALKSVQELSAQAGASLPDGIENAGDLYARAAREHCDRFSSFVERSEEWIALERMQGRFLGEHYLPSTTQMLSSLSNALEPASRLSGQDGGYKPSERAALKGPARCLTALKSQCAMLIHLGELPLVPTQQCLALMVLAGCGFKGDNDLGSVIRMARRTEST